MIWLTGNKGMLGTELSLLFERNNMVFTGTDIEIDITDPAALKDFTSGRSIKYIVNCSAYTAVDKAEDERERCRLLNTVGPANIAAVARAINAKLIHISTDYVFNGCSHRPYTEEDLTDPTGVYGLTKRDGEIKVLENNANSYIIRTAWLYGKHGNNFVHTMLGLMKERKCVSVVNDQWGSPTWTQDLSQAIITFIRLAEEEKTIPYGIYNFTNEGEITWFDFAREIYSQGRSRDIITNDCEVKPCASSEFPSKVKRPAYSALDKTKIKKTLRIDIPLWDTSLGKFLSEIA